MKYQILHKYQDSGWMPTGLSYDPLPIAIRKAHECSMDAIVYGMTAVLNIDNNYHVVEFPAGGGEPCFIHLRYESIVDAALEQKSVNGCPDCKDGFYYPLVGPKEPCLTCSSSVPSPDDSVPRLLVAWNNVPWGGSNPIKCPMPNNTGAISLLVCSCIIQPGHMFELIIDKLADCVKSYCMGGGACSFYQFKDPKFIIWDQEDGTTLIEAQLEIGLG